MTIIHIPEKIIHIPELDQLGEDFTTLPKEPLQVTLKTIKPVAGNDALHLDGFLAKAVVLEALAGRPLPDTEDAYYIPLPLGLSRLYMGLPVWQCNDFVAVDNHVGHTHYHQRSDANPYDKPAALATLKLKKKRRMPPTGEGQYMSYRVPLQYVEADRWVCECVGNKNEVARLLNTYLHYVGRKKAHGFGRVSSWSVESAGDFTLTRPTPITDELKYYDAHMMGWTPPYWHRRLWRLCA